MNSPNGIGLQLYTVRSHMEEDLAGTLARVAALGYNEVEFAGYFGYQPREIRRIVADVGLRAPSAHVPAEDLIKNPDYAFDAALTAGHHFVVIPWWEPELRTQKGYDDLLGLLDRVGPLASERGLKLAYHNHDFEFTTDFGEAPYDRLLRATDPDSVFFELDAYWVESCRRSALELLTTHPGRFPLLHLKNRDTSGMETDASCGDIELLPILDAAIQQGMAHVFIERDNPDNGLEAAKRGSIWLRQALMTG